MRLALALLLFAFASHAAEPEDKTWARVSKNTKYGVLVTPGSKFLPAFIKMMVGNKILWSVRLTNKVTPLDALVAEDGQFVATFDDASGDGSKAVVLFGPKGNMIANLNLGQLIGAAEAQRLLKEGTPAAWRKSARFDLEAGKLILVLPTAERQVDLKTGILSKAP